MCSRPSARAVPCCAFDPLTRTGRVRGLTFADGGYAGPKLRDALKAIGRWTLQIVKRSDTAEGFEVLPRRWVVERTLAWPGRCRRLSTRLIHPIPGKWLACPRKLRGINLLNEIRQQPSEHTTGETLQPFTTRFNKSLRVESRAERLTGDAGVVVLREIMERSGIARWMVPRLTDPRRREDVVHDLASLVRTSVLLAAQGWRDHDDADALRDDPAFRLAVSSASGRTPLDGPHGLASQPTLSRFTAIMSEPSNRSVLREAPSNSAPVARGPSAAANARVG